MSYKDDAIKGEVGVKIFTEFLDKRKVKWELVPIEHKADYDIKTDRGTYEVKCQMTSDRYTICIEEVGDMDKPGWIFTSKADWLIIVSPRQAHFIKINLKQLQASWDTISARYDLIENKPTAGEHGQVWISKFKRIGIWDLGDIQHSCTKL